MALALEYITFKICEIPVFVENERSISVVLQIQYQRSWQ